MASLTRFLFCLIAVLVTRSLAQESCYANEKDHYLYLSSKTAYEFVKDSSIPEGVPDCEPAQLWILSRHGTRYPHDDDIEEMRDLYDLRDEILKNHQKRQGGSLCARDLENIRRWSLDVASTQADELTLQGHMDLEFIARRYQSRFPTLLTQNYDATKFIFRHTNTQRTLASAEAFARGLFGGEEGSIPLPAPIDNDPLIEAFSNCTTWLNEVAGAPDVEQDLFNDGPLMKQMVKDVSERLGFKDKLPKKQITLMYDMCRYDKAWNVNQLSAWCAVFNKTDLMLLEYSQDLKYYYREGYGNEMNIKLGCPPVQDLMQRFSKLESEDSLNEEPRGVFYFTHSTAIQTTLSALGLARDHIKPDHSNYELMQNREWRVSKIGSFATNIAAVFFKCSKGDPHRIKFFLEEAVVPFEGCDEGLCSWAFIKDKFSNLTKDCNLDWCNDSARSRGSSQQRPDYFHPRCQPQSSDAKPASGIN